MSVIVLAGGQSQRLGRNKAFVEIGGQRLIDRVLRSVAPLTDDLIIVTNEPASFEDLRARLVSDVYPGKSSLGGIYSGLLAAKYERALVVGCDMPFLNEKLLCYMIAHSADYHLVIPRYNGFVEPLHAIYHKACLEPMRKLIEAGRLRIAEIFCEGQVRYIEEEELNLFDPERLSFFNVNTPDDLRRAHELAHLVPISNSESKNRGLSEEAPCR